MKARREAPEPRGELPAPLPCHEPTRTHTMTIYNGARVERQYFVWQHGSWQKSDAFHNYNVVGRDFTRSP
jgi:hypothetical protein